HPQLPGASRLPWLTRCSPGSHPGSSHLRALVVGGVALDRFTQHAQHTLKSRFMILFLQTRYPH
ncbi:hypothetical protein KA005_17010, partial [bacterium]|nr:hypothetical protein [bacterium]